MAACSSFLAPSLSNCSRNGFCSSFARSSSETTLFSGTGASFLFWRPRVRLPCFFFLIERMRLSLSPHPQLSVIALKKVALPALMRKLLICLNALLRKLADQHPSQQGLCLAKP